MCSAWTLAFWHFEHPPTWMYLAASAILPPMLTAFGLSSAKNWRPFMTKYNMPEDDILVAGRFWVHGVSDRRMDAWELREMRDGMWDDFQNAEMGLLRLDPGIRRAGFRPRRTPAGRVRPHVSASRRVVRLASDGPPGRPRPSSGDDDPHHPDVAPGRAVA